MHRGEVWLINLDPTVGAEIRKIRLAVIVNDNAVGLLPLRVIVPIRKWKDRYGVASLMPAMTLLGCRSGCGLRGGNCRSIRGNDQ